MPISRLAITGAELFLHNEVGFSPSFRVVLLEIQEGKQPKLSLEGDLVLCTFNLHYTFVTNLKRSGQMAYIKLALQIITSDVLKLQITSV